MTPAAAYVHIPFCLSKCHYCDFNSYPGMDEVFGPYAEAVCREISLAAEPERAAATLYIGGGTPTVMSVEQLGAMVGAVRDSLSLAEDAEATIEANPVTVDERKLEGLLAIGFNRISIGVQAFDDALLGRIGRRHTAAEARQAALDARAAGFRNISLDLIYALPSQTLADWRDTLRQAVELEPEHISLYELTIEPGTRFGELLREGGVSAQRRGGISPSPQPSPLKGEGVASPEASQDKLELPGEDLQIEMYALAESMLAASGYERYEISNFARPGFRCGHNQFYWRNEEYYGFGAGAVSYIDGRRAKNVSDPTEYIRRVSEIGSAIESSEELPLEGQMGETVMLGLRMTDGLDLGRFRERFGVDVSQVYQDELGKLTGLGLIEMRGACLRLTDRGVLLANEVMAEFVQTA